MTNEPASIAGTTVNKDGHRLVNFRCLEKAAVAMIVVAVALSTVEGKNGYCS